MLRFAVVAALAATFAHAGPVEFGMAELRAAFVARRIDPNRIRIKTELNQDPPETYKIQPGRISGGDLRGLMYGLLEAADQIRARGSLKMTSGAPATPMRGIRMFLHNEQLEKSWYDSDEYWTSFFQMLARNRFNRFNLVFAHQTNYLAPPYPYWVDVPEHPEVQAPGLTAEQRDRNLRRLRFISQTAADYGVDFTLGIWEHNIQPGMQPTVQGLTRENIGHYSYLALKKVLAACPLIRSVQMRTNSESGIPSDQQVEFYSEWIFRALRETGHLVTLDLRGWAMQPGMMDAVARSGVPFRVSSKYWAEDLGRPYQPAETWPGYSYLNFLEHIPVTRVVKPPVPAAPKPAAHEESPDEETPVAEPPVIPVQPAAPKLRPYGFYWEVWALGSNRLLLWGDPDYVRRAVPTFTLSGSLGFEIDAPLAQKGFGNRPGSWSIFTDANKDRMFWRWEFERYWLFYKLWGRLSYDTKDTSWVTEAQRRFGSAANDVLDAYRYASRVLPEIVAAHLADPNMYIWPEINPGGLIEAYKDVRPSDRRMIATIEESVRSRLEHKASAKQTPAQTAEILSDAANAAEQSIARARARLGDRNTEWRSSEPDFRVLTLLARYHAHKQIAAELLTEFDLAPNPADLAAAKRELEAGLANWESLVKLTDGLYPDTMAFGPDDAGHWKDKLPYVRHDLKLVAERQDIWSRFGAFGFGFDFGGPVAAPRAGSFRQDPYVVRNNVEPRFAAVDPETAWSDERGYGWVSPGTRNARPLPLTPYAEIRATKPNPEHLPQNALFGDWIHGEGPQTFRARTGDGEFEILVLKPDGSVDGRTQQAQNGVVDVVMPEAGWDIAGIVIRSKKAELVTALDARPPIKRPAITHTPVTSAPPHHPIVLTLRVSPVTGVAAVRLHYRAVNQLAAFKTIETSGNSLKFLIPGEDVAPQWDLMYYFEILNSSGGGWFHPNPRVETPYYVVKIEAVQSEAPAK